MCSGSVQVLRTQSAGPRTHSRRQCPQNSECRVWAFEFPESEPSMRQDCVQQRRTNIMVWMRRP
eukprot:3603669-Alexandrium_andersonii.AAC.1